MDTIRFEKVFLEPEWTDKLISGAKIIINGESLLDMVEAHENQMISSGKIENFVPSGYSHAFADQLYREFTDIESREKPNAIEVLICSGCLCEGCCPIHAIIEETNDSIILRNFAYPRRNDYEPFGHFQFAKEIFWREVNRLKDF